MPSQHCYELQAKPKNCMLPQPTEGWLQSINMQASKVSTHDPDCTHQTNAHSLLSCFKLRCGSEASTTKHKPFMQSSCRLV